MMSSESTEFWTRSRTQRWRSDTDSELAARYLRRRLASGEGIVTLGVMLSCYVCVRRISLDGEGNALYPVFSSLD